MTLAVITGASRGIGAAIARALAQAGCELVLAARGEAALQAQADAITEETGQPVRIVAADLRSAAGVAALAQATQGRPLAVLINNAGATRRGSLVDISDADFEDGFALKFMGAVRLTRALWPQLIAGSGSVVNIAGVAARTPTADFVVGSAVNAAVLAFTKAMADQGLRDGVRVNAINPGFINTGRLQRWIDALPAAKGLPPAEAEAALAQSFGVSRIGRPEEIAAMAVFLTLGGGSYCQGAVFDVDGGRSKGM